MSCCLLQEAAASFHTAFVHSASVYLKYVSVFRSLEDCYDAIIQPQKRRDILLTLELCMARICQLRRDLLLFSSAQPAALSTPDHVHLDHFLSALHLPPSALELPIPRYFRCLPEDEEARKRRDLVDRLTEEHAVMWGTAGQEVGLVSAETAERLAGMGRLTREQAIKIIQKNERGRQGAMRARLMRELREEDARKKRRESGQQGTRDDAALTIQKLWRGYRARKRVRQEEQEELVFLGMKPATNAFNQQTILALAQQPANTAPAGTDAAAVASTAALSSSALPSALPKYDPQVKQHQIRQQRRTRQQDAALQYSEALPKLQVELEQSEGEALRERMWEERYAWWVQEKEKTGKYPDSLAGFYLERYPNSDEAKKARQQAEAGGDGKKKGKTGKKAEAGAGKKDAKPAAANAGGKEDKAKDSGSSKKLEADGSGLSFGPTALVAHLAACVQSFSSTWLGRDESGNPEQSFDVELAKSRLRPLVEAKLRLSVDEQLSLYLDNIRIALQDRTAGAKKSKSGKSKAKAKQAQPPSDSKQQAEAGREEQKEQLSAAEQKQPEAQADGSVTPSGASKKEKSSAKGSGAAAAAAASKRCCEGDKLCSHLSLQDMIALLIKMNILQALPVAALSLPSNSATPPPATSLQLSALQGDANLVGSLAASAPAYADASVSSSSPAVPSSSPPHIDPSFQQLRAFFTESYILPLGSAFVHSATSPPLQSLLLFGPQGSGKTLVAKCIAKESGAVWFDLSARQMEKKLGTRAEIAKLVHIIFAVARQLAPAVLYLDEADRLFGSGKGRKGGGELSKLRALLLQHKQTLERTDRVLLIGCCRCPHSDKVDVKELLDCFPATHSGRVVMMPLPDYWTRLQLWTYFIQQTGLSVTALEKSPRFDLTSLAFISEGYSAGSIQQAVLATLPPRRVTKLLELDRSLDSSEFMTALSQTQYLHANEYSGNVQWLETVTGVKERRRLREMAEQAEKGTAEAEAAGGAADSKGKKGKK